MDIGTCTPDPTDNDTAEDLGSCIIYGYGFFFESLGTNAERSILAAGFNDASGGYWLACTGSEATNYVVGFGPGSVNLYANGKKLFYSYSSLFRSGSVNHHGSANCNNEARSFRAVVSLDSNIPNVVE